MKSAFENIRMSLGVIAILWVVHVAGWVLPLSRFGIVPRTMTGLIGIVFAPFLHANLAHLIGNSIVLFVLMLLALTYNQALAFKSFVIIIGVAGLGTWLFGATAVHIGVSSVIFGLAGYLIFLGIYTREFKAMVLTAIVLANYWLAIIIAFIPMAGISWSGHVFGFVGGIIAAKMASQVRKQ